MNRFSFIKITSIMFFFTTILIIFSGCSPKKEQSRPSESDKTMTETPIPRADPGFLQYLERKSMLSKAAEIAKAVSGSHIGWQSSASSMRADGLLDQADIWVSIHPLMLLVESRRDTFEYLSDSRFWSILRDVGIKGLYLSPTGGTGRLWAMNKENSLPETGEDIVQYDFSDIAGTEKTYRNLMGKIIDQHAVLGSDTVPAATGIGPDFFLAARNIREYPGAYCLVEIPASLWGSLPAVSSEWSGVALTQGAVNTLDSKGILPKSMLGNRIFAGQQSGWAVTAEITGADGNPRRWVYRYYNNPSQPILNWDDPSRAASRILSGSVVRQVGMQGQSLIGMRFDAFQSLDSTGLGPTLAATQNMSGEINRYGGWSWLRNTDISLEEMRQSLSSGADFIQDNALSPGAEHALLTADATLLRYMTDKVITTGLDSKRFVHTMPSYDGISYSLTALKRDTTSGNKEASALLVATLQQLSEAARGQSFMPVKNRTLYTTSIGLAAMALKIPADAIPENQVTEASKGHRLLLFFKAMQPGLLMLSGQDLVGTMALSPNSMAGTGEWDTSYASRGSYSLTPSSGIFVRSGQSIPKAQNAYAAADAQTMDKKSFLFNAGIFLRKRSEIGISKGTLIARPKTKGTGSIALLTQLPGKNHVLTVCNFSRRSINESIPLPDISKLGSPSSLAGEGTFAVSGSTVSVSLGSWQGKSILFGRGNITEEEAITSFPSDDPTEGLYPDEQPQQSEVAGTSKQTNIPAEESNVKNANPDFVNSADSKKAIDKQPKKERNRAPKKPATAPKNE